MLLLSIKQVIGYYFSIMPMLCFPLGLFSSAESKEVFKNPWGRAESKGVSLKGLLLTNFGIF